MLKFKFLIYPILTSMLISAFVAFMPETIVSTGWMFSNFISVTVILTVSFIYLFEKNSFIQMEAIKYETIISFFRNRLYRIIKQNSIYILFISLIFSMVSFLKVGGIDFKILFLYAFSLILLLSLIGYVILIATFLFKNTLAPYIVMVYIYGLYFYAFVNLNLSPFINPFIAYISGFSEFQGYGSEPIYYSSVAISGFLFSTFALFTLGFLILYGKTRKIEV
jgi:hypothetical protein